MSNCSGKLLSTVLAASLMGGTLLIASNRTARADDTCLAAPKAATPRGSHWYYHIEAGTKRHCWYLRDERGKTANAGTGTSSPAPAPNEPAAADAATQSQPVITDARAEFVDTAPAGSPANAAPSPIQEPTPANNAAQGADTSKSAVTTRWPDPATSVQQQPAPSAAVAPKPTSQLLGERSEPGPAVRVASAPPPQASSYSMPMLLGGLAGALAFAGFLGFTVVKFGSLSRRGRMRRRPESIWDNAATGQSPPPWQTQQTQEANPVPTPRGGTLRTRQDIEAQSRDILKLLSRASRETAT